MTKISVIIPVYNVEEYLPECLDSIINQTLSDIEIICVNDGSTDNSLNILNEYRDKDSRIKVLSQENSGVSEARNAAINEAQGEYIAMVDPDDTIEKNMLEILYNQAVKYDADIAECDLYEHRNLQIDSVKIRKLKYKVNFLTGLKIKSGKPYNWHDIKTQLLHIRAYVWNRIYKTALIKNKIIFEGRKQEDCPFVVEAFLCAEKIIYVNKPLYHYKKRANSLSAIKFTNDDIKSETEDIYKNCQRIENILNKYNLKREFVKDFDKFVTDRLFLEIDLLSKKIRAICRNLLDEKTFVTLEKRVQNGGKTFGERILSVSTEIIADITFKKLIFLGHVFLFKISK